MPPRYIITLCCLLTLSWSAAAVSAKEANRDYSGKDLAGIESIIQEVERSGEAWRVQADKRIAKYRMANLNVRVTTRAGRPIRDAQVHVELTRHAFHFGGVISAKRFAGKDNNTDADIDPELYKTVFLELFNKAGFHNALKYRLKDSFESYVPPALDWMREHDIPVRGHTLIWPSWRHMHKDAQRFKDGRNLRGLRKFCRDQIAEYAGKWDVVEWDVINEPRNNHDLMDLMGNRIMAEWFTLAKRHAYNRSPGLYLNENRVISAPNKAQEENLKTYHDTVRYLLKNGAPISGLGFQSRFKADIPAEEIYRRLTLFEDFNLPIAATEFEIAPGKNFQPDELKRAQLTERVMTVYFSHPHVVSVMVWTIFDREQPPTGMVNPDGTLKPNGKVWAYLTKNHWHTDANFTTNTAGKIKLRAFLGDYRITVGHGNASQTIDYTLDKKGGFVKVVLDKPKRPTSR